MEIVDVASLPNGFGANLTGCRINGAAIGDISSERVEIRLEKLTCIDSDTQQITVSQADGYVAGEDGRAGLRASLVIRDRALLMNSLLGGVLSGASKAVSQLASPVSTFNPLTGDVSRGQSRMDLLKQASGDGMSNALERYAKYHIELAEQLSPVLQVASNRVVDVVFKESTHFKELANVIERPVENKSASLRLTNKEMQKRQQEAHNFAGEILGDGE
jgi:conjugal transfer pilus assembly protein TraB